MNYLMKGKRSPKLSFDFNLKPKKNQIFFSTLVFRSKLIIKNDRKLSPTLKKIQANKNHILIKNYPKENKSNEDFDINDDKSTSNLTSTLISNEQNILKQNFTNHIITENNFDINISNKKRKSVNSLTNSLTRNDKTVNTISNNDNNNIKEIRRRYRHKQVKREICMSTTNNNPNNKMKDNKLENNNNKLIDHKLSPREYKNKSITIPINKKISDNILINQKQDKSFLDYFLLKNKMHKKTIKSNNIIENYKENKENIEINDNKSIYFIKRSKVNSKVKRIKFPPSNKIYNSKTNSKSKYINNGKKIIGNKYYKITLKEIKKKENEMKENNDIYFNENDLNENILSIKTEKNIEQNNRDSIINKVLHFKTECNGIFNQIKSNNKNNANNNSNLNEIQGNKKLKEKKESINSIINNENDKNNKEINIEENGDIKNIENIIKNNLDYNLNKRKFIMRKNDDNYLYQKLQKYNTHSTLNNDLILKTKIDSIIQKEKDESSINIKKDSSIPDNIDKQNSLTLNRDLMFTKKRFKSISLNLNKQPKKPQHLINNKNILYEIIENNKILQILYSFCEFDNNLLNKFCLLSKNIYKKIKPLIYQRISSIIFKYNENNNTKNKIKKYLMKNNSSLMKLSSTILHKKYTDLIFENNNKYDVDIRKDLTRTFPDNILFKYGNTYYNKLYHILTAYSNFNKNIGYIQGLNFLAANIIYFFEDEIDEFVFLDAIIHKFDFNKILDKNLNNNFFVKKLEKINLLLMKKLPKLNKFLSNIKLNFDFFITNWILTLFSDSIDTEYLTIIWDFMGIFGWKFFEYFVLNVFILCENSILNSTQNNLTYIKKNIFRNENFKKNFNNLIKDTVHSLINDEIII